MQNPKKHTIGVPTIISECIQLIIFYAHLRICGDLPFYRYKISHRLTKMSSANSDGRTPDKWCQFVDVGGRRETTKNPTFSGRVLISQLLEKISSSDR
jgi:hypothetical protein